MANNISFENLFDQANFPGKYTKNMGYLNNYIDRFLPIFIECSCAKYGKIQLKIVIFLHRFVVNNSKFLYKPEIEKKI